MSKFNFDKKARALDGNKILNVMSNNAVNYFKIEVFNAEAFDGKKWAGRKKPDPGRRLLVKTGRLRSSIRELGRGLNYRRVGSDVPYATFHNNGTKRMPRRQFIGPSKKIEEFNRKTIADFTKKALATR